jgi:multidrug efflux pump subunit AcrA (membrane-fusion protein)
MAKRKVLRRLIYVVILAAILAGGTLIWSPWRSKSAPDVPTADVKVGEFVEYVQVRGEVRVRSSAFVLAPYNAGDLQILKLVKDGSIVKKGDVVVEFDPTALKRNVDQFAFALKQADAQIARAKAQQQQREEQYLTDKMVAEFGLERARLDASKGEVVPEAENIKLRLGLASAEAKLKEVDQQIASGRVGAEADLVGLIRKRDKARLDLEQAQQRTAALSLPSPADGLIMLLPNTRARATGTSTYPNFKEGDRAYAGASIAEVPDLSTVQVNAPVDEADRGRIDKDQEVSVKVDALPDKELKGRVGAISTIARVDMNSYPYKKNFDMTVLLDQLDSRLRPGMSATVRVAVLRLPNSILIPVEAVFEKGNRIVSYVLVDGRFEERSIEAARRGETQVMVTRGLQPGDRVALKDPTLESEAGK